MDLLFWYTALGMPLLLIGGALAMLWHFDRTAAKQSIDPSTKRHPAE
jgi:hypothetical protein